MLFVQNPCSSLLPTPSRSGQWPRPAAQHIHKRTLCVRAEAAERDAASPASAGEAGPQRCKTCGIELTNAPRGCDNEGHVIKGLGSWPGFGWFEALRVYGPCSELQKNGIAYTRKGQSLDEIMFGSKGK